MSVPSHLSRRIPELVEITPRGDFNQKNPNALFIGYSPHKKTLSSNFMMDLLSQRYNLWTASLNRINTNLAPSDTEHLPEFDLVVFWQVMPSVEALRQVIRFKRVAFCPMADSFYSTDGLSNQIWQEYLDVPIISFSRKMHDDLKSNGFSSHYFQYFPSIPNGNNAEGDPRSVFLWERLSEINPTTVMTVLGDYKIRHLHIHAVRDDGRPVTDTPANSHSCRITRSEWFPGKDAMLESIRKSSIYFAPRRYEGIGMSFLEAMACGRCVFASDETTMNEYIAHGQTGFLYSLDNISAVRDLSATTIRSVQSNTLDYMSEGRRKWLSCQKNELLDAVS